MTVLEEAGDRMFAVPEMFERPALAAADAAVVVVDMVNHQLTPGAWLLGDLARRGVATDYIVERVRTVVVPAHRRLLDAARRTGARVVYLQVGTASDDHADGVTAMKPMYPIWEAHAASPACDVVDALAPQSGDLCLMKLGSGGFTTSSLDLHLRNLDVRHVLYTGVVTNACVLLTLTAGFDLGYHGYLVSDATATFSERLQGNTEEIAAPFAEVVTTDDVIARLERSVAARGATV